MGKNTRIDYECDHNEDQRSFTTTVTHMELAEALRNNYIVDRVYRIWSYKVFDKNLFKDYVRMFLKIKVFLYICFKNKIF